MKVLVDARLGWGSGIGRFAANTIPRVARSLPGIQFVAQVLPGDHEFASRKLAGPANLSVVPVDIEPFSLREQFALSGLAKGYDFTWFTNYWVPLNFSGRYIATVHDLLHLDTQLFPASPVKRALARQTFAKLRRSAAALTFVSRFSEREFTSRFGRGPELCVHHNGIDHNGWEPFDPDRPPAKSKRLLTVGASKYHKNFQTLLDAWRQAQVGDHWTLTIISPDAKQRSSIDLQAVAEGAGRTDIRLGVTDAELRALYADTQIMLTPSLYEGFGLPFLEAMQAGAFCISSTADSMVEIGEGAFAYYVNPRDVAGWVKAIERSCAMFDRGDFDFAPLQRHNMRHAMEYSWQRTADIIADTLGRII